MGVGWVLFIPMTNGNIPHRHSTSGAQNLSVCALVEVRKGKKEVGEGLKANKAEPTGPRD
jgi:hypothetical protein